jgi:hypothetical protein
MLTSDGSILLLGRSGIRGRAASAARPSGLPDPNGGRC